MAFRGFFFLILSVSFICLCTSAVTGTTGNTTRKPAKITHASTTPKPTTKHSHTPTTPKPNTTAAKISHTSTSSNSTTTSAKISHKSTSSKPNTTPARISHAPTSSKPNTTASKISHSPTSTKLNTTVAKISNTSTILNSTTTAPKADNKTASLVTKHDGHHGVTTSKNETVTASNNTKTSKATTKYAHTTATYAQTTTPEPIAQKLIDMVPHILNNLAENRTWSFTDALKHLSKEDQQLILGLKQNLLAILAPALMKGLGSPLEDLFKVIMALKAGTITIGDLTKSVDFVGLLKSVAYKFINPKLDKFKEYMPKCVPGIGLFINSFLEKDIPSWAIQMLDAAGKPPTGILKGPLSWVGTPGECREAKIPVDGIEPAFCSAFIEPPAGLVQLLTGGRPLPAGHQVQFDVCLPNTCSEAEMTLFLDKLTGFLGMAVTRVHCQKEYGPLKDDTKAIVAICVFSLLLFLTVISTIIYYVRRHTENKKNEMMLESLTSNGNVNTGKADTDKIETPDLNIYTASEIQESLKYPDVQSSFLSKLLLVFALPVNLRRTTSTKPNEHTITCLHGIRVLSMGYIILGNTYYFLINKNVLQNGVDMLEAIHDFTSQPIINSTLAIDTFFLISGTLVCYLFLLETRRRDGLSIIQIAQFYLHRIWRMTPFYALILLFYYTLSPYLLDGPIDVKDDPDRTNCASNWWLNLLYVNNLVHSENLCMAWTWYLSCDMQFFIISPLVMLPLFGFKYIGAVLVLALVLLQMGMTGFLENKNGGNIISPGSMNSDFFQDIFIKPYTRVAPYAIGLFLGYILHFKKKFKLKTPVIIVCWLLAVDFLIMLPLITYTNNYKGVVPYWCNLGQAFHQAFSRPLWALAVAWIIFACVNGYAGPVNKLLSWKAWAPLSRVTFAAYLIHPILLSAQDYNIHTLVYYNTQTIISCFAGTVTLAYGLAFVASALFEAPWKRFEEAIFPGRLKRELYAA